MCGEATERRIPASRKRKAQQNVYDQSESCYQCEQVFPIHVHVLDADLVSLSFCFSSFVSCGHALEIEVDYVFVYN